MRNVTGDTRADLLGCSGGDEWIPDCVRLTPLAEEEASVSVAHVTVRLGKLMQNEHHPNWLSLGAGYRAVATHVTEEVPWTFDIVSDPSVDPARFDLLRGGWPWLNYTHVFVHPLLSPETLTSFQRVDKYRRSTTGTATSKGSTIREARDWYTALNAGAQLLPIEQFKSGVTIDHFIQYARTGADTTGSNRTATAGITPPAIRADLERMAAQAAAVKFGLDLLAHVPVTKWTLDHIKHLQQITCSAEAGVDDGHGARVASSIGRFRSGYVTVGRVLPPAPPEIDHLMAVWLDWIKHSYLCVTVNDSDAAGVAPASLKSLHPLQFIFDSSAAFSYLHPFDDCNGRTDRALIAVLLAHFGYPPFLIWRWNDEDRFLKASRDAGEPALWSARKPKLSPEAKQQLAVMRPKHRPPPKRRVAVMMIDAMELANIHKRAPFYELLSHWTAIGGERFDEAMRTIEQHHQSAPATRSGTTFRPSAAELALAAFSAIHHHHST